LLGRWIGPVSGQEFADLGDSVGNIAEEGGAAVGEAADARERCSVGVGACVDGIVELSDVFQAVGVGEVA